MTPSAAGSAAEFTLFDDPERYVALVLNSADWPVPVEERRSSLVRRFSKVSPDSYWQIAFAEPDIESWALADPRVGPILGPPEATWSKRVERAERINRLAQETPLDREAIGREYPEFHALVEFVERVAESQPTVSA